MLVPNVVLSLEKTGVLANLSGVIAILKMVSLE
jgi:hypothetical protein